MIEKKEQFYCKHTFEYLVKKQYDVEQCLGLQTSFYSIRMATFFDKYFILRSFQIFIMDLAKH